MGKPPLEIPGPLGTRQPRRWLANFRRRTHPTLVVLGELLPRTLDILFSATLLILLSPVLLVRALWSRRQTGDVLTEDRLIGRYQAPFRRLSFAGSGKFPGSDVWAFVFRGDMSIVGPRPLEAE